MRNEDDVKAMVAQVMDEYGKIDILFNNAGHGLADDVEKVTTEDWKEVTDVNLHGTVYRLAEVGVAMLQQAGDMNIGSHVRLDRQYAAEPMCAQRLQGRTYHADLSLWRRNGRCAGGVCERALPGIHAHGNERRPLPAQGSGN